MEIGAEEAPPSFTGGVIVAMPDNKLSLLRATWHTISAADAAYRVSTSIQDGLTSTEAAARLRDFGLNQLKGQAGVNPVVLYLKNLFNFLSILLIVAMVLSFATTEYIEGGVLAAIILFNSVIGFVQEYKSERTLEALNKLAASTAKVMRDGKLQQINSNQVVLGDVVELDTGCSVPADVRLFQANKMDLDESMLTGESAPVRKGIAAVPTADIPLGDRINMAYFGCNVVRGRGRGVVIATGMHTELGHIAHRVSAESANKGSTHLEREIRTLSIVLFSLGLLFGFVVFAANRFVWSNETLLYAITLVVAVIPESLPVMLTLTMSIGMKRMAKRNAIVRKIGVLETLGRVTDICSDKTGTLTQAKMVAVNVWLPHRVYHVTGVGLNPAGEFLSEGVQAELDESSLTMLRICAICNESALDQTVEGEYKGLGTPTEVALLVLAMKGNIRRDMVLESLNQRVVATLPFDSEAKTMTVVCRMKERGCIGYTKGAPEKVLQCCTRVLSHGEEVPLPDDFASRIMYVMQQMTSSGQRVLCMAYRSGFVYQKDMTRKEIDRDMVFVGLVGIMDPPRPESGPSVKLCDEAGITVHMLTGDHPNTATAIATDIGITPHDESALQMIMTATEFDQMQPAQADQLLELPRVIARCAPDTKVRMVKALHRRGRIVVMTGDGVNDAPALKAADAGVAMGTTGSEVTKQAADIVLVDDNFASIVAAVEEGRFIFASIKKFVVHEICSNIASLLILVLSLSFRDPQNLSVFPLSALQTLWVNTLIVALPSLALTNEPRDDVCTELSM
eukprot:TRINITY_DN5657_c0_g1_i1.p1 TRINITY_DN5657_c0_g1~~TRINITY_DN5657_c0_g1_i1.p1  ORF type:complete len:910 (-),score=253.79 TRINITY_DN5657_c0_g1_i1:585-2963(-)